MRFERCYGPMGVFTNEIRALRANELPALVIKTADGGGGSVGGGSPAFYYLATLLITVVTAVTARKNGESVVCMVVPGP